MKKEDSNKIRCCWSKTLGELEGTAEKTWGTKPYNPETDRDLPCVFFGLYGLPDFYTLWRHRGKKWILWAGTDILHFCNGYWLDEAGEIRVQPFDLAVWINEYCESWCENVVERKQLAAWGIDAKVCPSFLGDVGDFAITFKPAKKHTTVYASVSGDNFEQYGWDAIERIAWRVPEITFALYGNKKPWKTIHKNVHVIGRLPKEVMNHDVADMQCGIRPLEFDGASEILMKSALMGQWPISRIPYPHIDSYSTDDELVALLKKLPSKKEPNRAARNYYIRRLNQFPWVKK